MCVYQLYFQISINVTHKQIIQNGDQMLTADQPKWIWDIKAITGEPVNYHRHTDFKAPLVTFYVMPLYPYETLWQFQRWRFWFACSQQQQSSRKHRIIIQMKLWRNSLNQLYTLPNDLTGFFSLKIWKYVWLQFTLIIQFHKIITPSKSTPSCALCVWGAARRY